MSPPPWRIPTALTEQLGGLLTGRLLQLTREVAKMGHADGVFGLSARHAGRIWGCGRDAACTSLNALAEAGALERLVVGKFAPEHSLASRWRFTDALLRPVDKSRSAANGQSGKPDCDSPENRTFLDNPSGYLSPSRDAPAAAVYITTSHHQPCSCAACLRRKEAQ